LINIKVTINKTESKKEKLRKKEALERVLVVQDNIMLEAELNPEQWKALPEEWWGLELAWRLEQLTEIEAIANNFKKQHRL
jgi:hypothetical protein